MRKLLEMHIAAIIKKFNWPQAQQPSLLINYIDNPHYHGSIAFTEFLVAIVITPSGSLRFIPHTYTLTVNYYEFKHLPKIVQDFVFAHEIAHVQQLQEKPTVFVLQKLIALPAMLNSGLLIMIAVALAIPYANTFFYIWVALTLTGNYFSRHSELDADKRAACALGQKQGAELFLRDYQGYYSGLYKYFLRILFYHTFATHPAPEKRIIKLKELTCPPSKL